MTREGWLMIIPVCSLCLFLHHFIPHCSSERTHTHTLTLPPTYQFNSKTLYWHEIHLLRRLCTSAARWSTVLRASIISSRPKSFIRQPEWQSRITPWIKQNDMMPLHIASVGSALSSSLSGFFAPHYKDQRVSLVSDRTPVNSVPAKIQQETLIDENNVSWVRPEQPHPTTQDSNLNLCTYGWEYWSTPAMWVI